MTSRRLRPGRIISLSVGGAALLVGVLSLVHPWVEDGPIAVTVCYPIVGPVQRFNPGLTDTLLPRVRAHEQAHAAQCLRDGAIWHNLRRLAPGGRLKSEAGAYCAEVRLSVATGRNARLAYPSALDELRDETWFHRFTDAELATALNRECPDMAELARGEETKWRDWVNANHAASEQLVDAPHEP